MNGRPLPFFCFCMQFNHISFPLESDFIYSLLCTAVLKTYICYKLKWHIRAAVWARIAEGHTSESFLLPSGTGFRPMGSSFLIGWSSSLLCQPSLARQAVTSLSTLDSSVLVVQTDWTLLLGSHLTGGLTRLLKFAAGISWQHILVSAWLLLLLLLLLSSCDTGLAV